MKSWPFWKILAVCAPLSYAVALAAIIALDKFLWPAPCNATTIISGVEAASFPSWCFQYMRYQNLWTHLIVLAHAVFLLGLTLHYRSRGPRWLMFLAFAGSVLYVLVSAHGLYRFFFPDPSLVPIIDHF